MTTDNRWYSILDDLDAHLHQQAEAIDAGRGELIEAFTLPAGIGSLPPNLEPRLALLRRRSAELTAEVATRRDEIEHRLAALPRHRLAGRPSACYFDTSA